MQKGLKLRLPSEVTDTTLPLLDEYRVIFKRSGDGTGRTEFFPWLNADTEVSIVGGHFVDGVTGAILPPTITMTASTIAAATFVATESEGYISVKNSDAIQSLGNSDLKAFHMYDFANSPVAVLDLDEIPTNITTLNTGHCACVGNLVECLRRLKSIEAIAITRGDDFDHTVNPNFDEEYLTGEMKKGVYDVMPSTLLTLNIQARTRAILSIDGFSGCTQLSTFKVIGVHFGSKNNNTTIIGDLSSITQLANIVVWQIEQVKDFVTGDLSVFWSHLQACTTCIMSNNATISGAISGLPSAVVWASFAKNPNLRTYAPRVYSNAIAGMNFESAILDAATADVLLNDIAQAAWNPGALLVLGGTRTSASNSAIATLAGKGVTVWLGGVIQ